MDQNTTSSDSWHDPEAEILHRNHPWTEDVPVGHTVVKAVAAVANREPLDLRPLYEAIDVDALDDLIANSDDSELCVCFDFEGYPVTVHSSGRVEVNLSNESKPRKTETEE